MSAAYQTSLYIVRLRLRARLHFRLRLTSAANYDIRGVQVLSIICGFDPTLHYPVQVSHYSLMLLSYCSIIQGLGLGVHMDARDLFLEPRGYHFYL